MSSAKIVVGVCVGAVGALLPSIAAAAPITVSNAYHYLDNRGPSNTGLNSGVRTVFGALTVQPNGNGGTFGSATNPNYQGGAPVPLFFQSQIVGSDEFAATLPAASAPLTPWTLSFANGPDLQQAVTPDLVGASLMGFARNVAVSGTSTPTLSWQAAAGQSYDAVRLNFYNLDQRVNGLATLFRSVNLQSAAASAFTIPAAWGLQVGTGYSVEISLIETRDGTGSLTQSNLLSRSRSFFDFSLLTTAVPGPVYLPTVVPATTNSPYQFTFNISGVSNDTTTFIDPEIAVGYDYAIGAGDPNFSAFELPDVGDGLFDLYLWDGTAWMFSQVVQAGDLVQFGGAGVSQFRILGIETSAGLDPADGTAFVTGLRFVSNGDFTGTMTPIVVEIPEPGTLMLTFGALAAMCVRGSRRSSFTPQPQQG